ncbi:tyrosine-type recombinase/integrase [Agathobaculum massiliense]|uniref:tyrosine-type recombinase/integrase n=1 Tax=Agathobaculum massiliense TaxID=3014267 RepID=UPI000D1E1272|nr:tyrosine-type recombinase/integrase [Agathobaculum massiliense]
MNGYRLTEQLLVAYAHHLHAEERSYGTIEKYLRDVRSFFVWLTGKPVTRALASSWKEHLISLRYAPATINSMIAALNSLFNFLGWEECRVRLLKIQRRLFRDESRELSRSDYERLLETAQGRGQERLALLMETICATGIRASEVRYITVEAAQESRAEIMLKGKIRTILLPRKLCRKLLKYAKKQKTVSGGIFRTRNGNPLSRRQIWAELKRLCKYAGVEPAKVFPHNLRHLFATTFYRVSRDIVRLADLLGHSSIETTRIYLLTSSAEHQRQLECLGLVS